MSKVFAELRRLARLQGWPTTVWRTAVILLLVVPMHTIGVLVELLGTAISKLGWWLQIISLAVVGRHPNDL